MTLETYIAYLATIAVFFATPPGPSQSLMIANSLRHGVRRSTATVWGDLSANMLQMTAAAFGLAILISTAYEVLVVIKWAGVAYLLWMGWRTFTAPPRDLSDVKAGRQSPSKLWRQGFLTSASNPKAIFFFAALFPQFIDIQAAVWPQLLILGTTYLFVDGVLLIAWGFLARGLLGRIRSLGRHLNRVSGGLMIAAAGLLAFKDVELHESR